MKFSKDSSDAGALALGKPGVFMALSFLIVAVVTVGLTVRRVAGSGPDAAAVGRFECEKCGHLFEVDLRQQPEMAELLPRQFHPDCPKCGATGSAWETVTCPNCGRYYVPRSVKTGQDAAADVCPHCGAKFMETARRRTKRLGKGERRQAR